MATLFVVGSFPDDRDRGALGPWQRYSSSEVSQTGALGGGAAPGIAAPWAPGAGLSCALKRTFFVWSGCPFARRRAHPPPPSPPPFFKGGGFPAGQALAHFRFAA